MLLQKQQTVPYTGVFKLNSGEEFIAKVVNETDSTLTVSKPLCLVDTGQGLRFAPFMMMADLDEDIILPKPIVQGKPNKQIFDQYETSTSAIALPKKQSIIV